MKYDHYSLEDFLTDTFFLQWVKHPDPESTAFWLSWLKKHPEKVPLVEEAKEMITSFRFEEDVIPAHRIVFLQAAIHHSIDHPQTPAHVPIPPQSHRNKWYWLAASLVLITGLFTFLYFGMLSKTAIEVSSGYGETKTVFLPDSSRVTLNANSQLSYAKDWKTGDRQVYLKGEAFFEVRKLKAKQTDAAAKAGHRKFIVHTEGIAVEVLGTTFDVLHRHGETKVVLKTGQVKVIDTKDRQEIMMKPGEMVKASRRQLVKKEVDPAAYIAWKDNQLVFKETSLGKIAQLLEDNYNFQVSVEDNQLRQKTFVGTFPADDIRVLLQTLTKSLDVKIDKRQKKILFKKKK